MQSTLVRSASPSLYDTGLAQPLHDEFEIGGVLEGQDFATVFQGVVGIDAHHLLPRRASLFETVEVPVTGGQKRARDIGDGGCG